MHGKGEPLLLVMGLGRGVDGWRLQTPVFAEHYRVIVFDNRGSGRTSSPDTYYTMEMMAGDAVALLDVLGIEKAHVLGKSMGGYIAQEIAIGHPGRVQSLILAATSAGPYVLQHGLLKAWVSRVLPGLSKQEFFSLLLPFMFNDITFEDDVMVRLALGAIAGRNQTPAMKRQLQACAAHCARGRLEQVSAPTLVLAGKQDTFLPIRLTLELARCIPGAKLTMVDGGGHGLNEDIPDAFNNAVLDFLARLR